METFNIKIDFAPAYHAATNGALERQHQTIKNALKASLIDMGNTHRDQWMKALPWVMLGKRMAYQPHLDTSSAQLVLGMSPAAPGALLGDPGAPLTGTEIKILLNELYKMADRPPIQMSGKREKFDITNTDEATHVYIKTANPLSLCPKFEGPYPIVARPSRSQVQVKLGVKADNSLRLQTYSLGFMQGSSPERGCPGGPKTQAWSSDSKTSSS